MIFTKIKVSNGNAPISKVFYCDIIILETNEVIPSLRIPICLRHSNLVSKSIYSIKELVNPLAAPNLIWLHFVYRKYDSLMSIASIRIWTGIGLHVEFLCLNIYFYVFVVYCIFKWSVFNRSFSIVLYKIFKTTYKAYKFHHLVNYIKLCFPNISIYILF